MFKGSMSGMMKKAQKIQQDMQKAQAEIKQMSVTGVAANGAIQITLNGDYRTTSVKIEPAQLNDAELLEDLILTAINDATQQISDISSKRMKSVTGGINLPI